MNKIITLGISLLFVFSALHAQKIDYDNSSKWFLGFNVGGTWHTSDVKNDLNGGWGVTLGKSFNYNYGKRLSFDIRARYLGGRWYGQDYDLTTLDSLSYFQREFKPLAAYADSSSFSIVNNFQTELHSLSLELVLHANGIRERSGWDPYIFGGIGVKWYQTFGDLLDQDSLGGTYDYSSLGNDINSTTLNMLNDGIYDSPLEGSYQDKYSVAVMPSLGFGLGYQVGKRVSLGLEHKTTFTGADVFDGYTSSVGKFKQDLYHYTSFYVQFRFRTNARGGGSTNVNNIENYNTNQNNLTNCNTPAINFRSPESVSSVTTTQVYNLTADVYNVSIRENLQLIVNGVPTTNFSYNPSTGRLESSVLLSEGANSVEIKATNSCGPTNSTVSINYEPCKIPVLNLTSPTVTNSTVSTAQFSFSATVLNIVGTQGVTVTQNGKNVTNTSFNGNVLSGNVTLENGVNTFVISATSTCGVDSETFTVNYLACLFPTINFVTPSTNNSTVTTPAQTITATIKNVANSQNITVTQNGKALTGSTYANSTLRRNVTLVSGTNTFVITATNSCGTVSETITINYNNCIPPTISWTAPSVNNSTVTNASYALVAQIGNVSNAQGVVLTQNGQTLTGSTFTGGSLRRNVTLVSGTNTFVITATNSCGTVSETITINYNNCVPPTISWTAPSVNNSTVTNASYSLVAQIGNVSNAQGVVLTQNGQTLTGAVFAGGSLRRNVTLVSGVNTFVITATNSCGTVSETITINYNDCIPPTISWTAPSVNNSTVTNASYALVAQIGNVSNAQGVVLTQNGQTLTGAVFAGGSLRRNVTLVSGTNTFVITATNSCGTVSETITINYNNCIPPTISWTAPSVNNSTATNASYALVAQIGNVNSAQGVVLTQNGQTLTGSTFTGGSLRRNVTLVSGTNTFVITATNSCGTVSETITINYNDCIPPTISWTAPSVNNSTVTNASYSLVAQIGNVSNAQGVVLTQNGQTLKGAVFAGGSLRRNVTLVSGTNTFVITATNSCGTVSETITINYNDCIPPTISWTAPSVNNSTVTNASYALVAQIGNVSNAQGVVLTQNGQTLTGAVFAGGSLRRNVTLVSGVNTFVITATNSCGTVSETITINYNDCIPPTISWTAPSVNNSTVTNASYTLVAQIGNVSNAQGVVLTQNGQTLTGAVFAGGSLRRNVTLVSGVNTFVITATNSCGTVSETITINYNNCVPPSVTGISPVQNNASVTNPNLTLTVQMQNIVSGQSIQMTQNSAPFTNFTFANGTITATITATITLIQGPNVFTITASNGCGAVNETLVVNYKPVVETPNQSEPERKITICHYPPGNNGNPQTIEIPLSAWPAHQAHGDVLGPCPVQEPDPEPVQEQKITICHYPPGNNGNPQTIEIPLSAWPAHQAHGDVLGPCPVQVPDPEPVQEQKITICHYPPGNNGNPQTIEIPLSAWPAHQAHGDVLGPCPVQVPDPEPVQEQKITICHYPPGNNSNPQTIEIPLSAWPAHQAHGDVLGPCVDAPSGNGNGNQGSNGNSNNNQGNQGGNGSNGNSGNNNLNNDQETKIMICHYPPGNNSNPQTIEIPLSAWPAHQAHGDVLGPCVDAPSGNGNGNQGSNGNSNNNQGNQGGNGSNGNSGNDQSGDEGSSGSTNTEGTSNGSGLGGVGTVGNGGNGQGGNGQGGRSNEGNGDGTKKPTTGKTTNPVKPKPQPVPVKPKTETPVPKSTEPKEGETIEKEGDKKPTIQTNQTPKGRG